MKLWITCALILSVNIGSLAESDPFSDDDNDPKNDQPIHVRVQLKMIELSQTELTRITNNPQLSQKSLYTSIQRLMKVDKAKLIHESVVASQSGEKSTTTSVCEMIYPTEYNPPGRQLKIPSTVPRLRPSGSTPVAFETRNIGVSLEVESIISADRKTIDLRIAPERVMLNRNIIHLTHKDQWGSVVISHPEFSVQKTSTALTLLNKQPQLISTYTPHDKEGKPDPSRKILVFVKATVITPQ